MTRRCSYAFLGDLFLSALLLGVSPLYSQTDISEELETIRTNRCMPGLSALVVREGHVIAQGAAGCRREGDPAPLQVADRINIASCTKWMTATLAARLVDQGVISWDTQIREVFTNMPSIDPAFADRTLDHFLCHRSGLGDASFNKYQKDFLRRKESPVHLRRWAIEAILSEPPLYKPDTYSYSNIGYAVAASMLENKTGKSWETLMQEEVFTPLKMDHSTIGIVFDNMIPPKVPVGHFLEKGKSLPKPLPALDSNQQSHDQAILGPGGFVACTLHDWAAFVGAHIGATNRHYLLPETAAKLQQPYSETDGDYGRGIGVVSRTWATPGKALTHSGLYVGQNCVLWAAPAKNFFVVVYTNCHSPNTPSASAGACDDVAALAIRCFLAQHQNDTP